MLLISKPHTLFRTLNHIADVNQSEERLATHIGSWASGQNLFVPFRMSLSRLIHTQCTDMNLLERQCTPRLLPQPGAFYILCSFHDVLLTLSFNPM